MVQQLELITVKWQTDHEWSLVISCQTYLLKCQCTVAGNWQPSQIHSLHHTHTDLVIAVSPKTAFTEVSTSPGLMLDCWP